MGVITQEHTAYTMSDERFAQITKRLSALRRSTFERLYRLQQTLDADAVPAEREFWGTSKSMAMVRILTLEFGEQTLETYYAVKVQRKARKPRRTRGQYTLPNVTP